MHEPLSSTHRTHLPLNQTFFSIPYCVWVSRPTPPTGGWRYTFAIPTFAHVCSSRCCSCHLSVGLGSSQHSHAFLESTFAVCLGYLTFPTGTARPPARNVHETGRSRPSPTPLGRTRIPVTVGRKNYSARVFFLTNLSLPVKILQRTLGSRRFP